VLEIFEQAAVIAREPGDIRTDIPSL